MIRDVLELALAALVVLAVATAVVLASPVRTCPRCKGERVARHWPTKRIGTCRRCRGHGETYRRGAVLAHRLLWEIRGAVTSPPERKETKP
jgi:hypothetical protein